MNQDVAQELMRLRREDDATRTRLMESGELFDNYSKEMEEVHLRNAAALEKILDEHGWPGFSLVGEDGCEAAWLISQHAISSPDLQRRCRDLLDQAVVNGEAPPWQAAHLIDRIRVNEGRPQLFATQFDWDEDGELTPHPVESPFDLDARRAEAGLVPLAEAVKMAREMAHREGHHPPPERAESAEARAEWARRVGWIE